MAPAAASVAAALAALTLATPGAPGVAAPAISAKFVLETKDAATQEKTSGVVRFMPGGNVCVLVESPLAQQMLLSAREMVIFYPDRDVALVAKIAEGKAPPLLEAMAAALSDPAAILPKASRLVEQRREGPNLLTRWRVIGASGDDLGEMRSVESREGPLSIEVFDRSGHPQRRFSFTDRVRVGGRTVPRKVAADFFGAKGAHRRGERWTLSDVARYDAAAAAAAPCARLGPRTRVQDLPW